MSERDIDRREFFRKMTLITTGSLVSLFGVKPLKNLFGNTLSTNNRVVWLHDSRATFWNGSGYYGDFVDQERVNNMFDLGILVLTGENNIISAWQQLIPTYVSGQKIGIKVNNNNSNTGNSINAVAAPIIAIISSLKSFGILEEDIYILEPSREFPSRFADPILFVFPNILLWDSIGSFGHQVTYDYNINSSTTIHHSNPGLTGNDAYSYMPEQMAQIDYLINVPIMKGHSVAEISLAFKNHFGTLKKWTVSKLHDFSLPGRPFYSYDMNPLHDIYLNQNIRNKTILTVGDGLFCSRTDTEGVPEVWTTFNGEFPNSLFLSTDPVAIDSVMYDFLNEEVARTEQSQLYLHRAQELGLGVHDHWSNPVTKLYANIDFRQIEMSQINRSNVDQIIKEYKSGNATRQEVKNIIDQYLKGNTSKR